MITAVGIGLLGFGIMLVYAAVTGQSLRDELSEAFMGGPGAGDTRVDPGAAARPAPTATPFFGRAR